MLGVFASMFRLPEVPSLWGSGTSNQWLIPCGVPGSRVGSLRSTAGGVYSSLMVAYVPEDKGLLRPPQLARSLLSFPASGRGILWQVGQVEPER